MGAGLGFKHAVQLQYEKMEEINCTQGMQNDHAPSSPYAADRVLLVAMFTSAKQPCPFQVCKDFKVIH